MQIQNHCALVAVNLVLALSLGASQPTDSQTGSKPQADAPVVPPSATAPAGKPSAETTGYVEVDGGKLYYEAAGSGPAVVLIHDGLLHSEVWDGQWDDFSKDYRIIRYDRRGYGRSPAPGAPYSNVEDLLAVLRTLDVQRATLIGSSNGGRLAIDFALTYPDMVATLVLVGTPIDSMGYSAHFIQRSYANLAADEEASIVKWVEDRYIIAPTNKTARERARSLLKANPQDFNDEKHQYVKAPGQDVLANLSRIRVPTLILVGAEDIADIHAHAGAIEAGIPGSQRAVIANAGHLAYLEQPEAFNEVVRQFLSLTARPTKGGIRQYESGFAPVDGGFLYYQAMGRGEPLVLIHGGSIDHRMWDGQVRALARRYRVILYDVRGHGLSKGPPRSYRDEEDLYRLLKHLGVRRAHVLGLSLGGRIAIDFAIEHPDMVGCLIPVAPGLSGYRFEGADFAEDHRRQAEAIQSGDYEKARELVLRSWTDGPQRSPDQVDPKVRQAVSGMLKHGMAPGRTMGRSLPLKPPAIERLGEIRAPTLAVVGTLDMSDILKIVDRLVAEIPGARPATVDSVAHMVNMERPDEFNRIVLAFLEEHKITPKGGTAPPEASSQPAQSDLAVAESVVSELYRRVTFKADESPDWDSVRALFDPEAVIVLRTARDKTTVFSLDGFIDDFVRFIERSDAQRRGFSEKIIRTKPIVYGDIAHVLVLYEARLEGTDRQPQRGVDSIELIRRNGRWWIVAIANEICTPERPAPPELQD
ncbi:MAG TPA: alpha/beta fold hydrolase [Phycisphaerae bacterium]|nr:alpha/beta fold hydrolase [Phycisphaerae bacterium]